MTKAIAVSTLSFPWFPLLFLFIHRRRFHFPSIIYSRCITLHPFSSSCINILFPFLLGELEKKIGETHEIECKSTRSCTEFDRHSNPCDLQGEEANNGPIVLYVTFPAALSTTTSAGVSDGKTQLLHLPVDPRDSIQSICTIEKRPTPTAISIVFYLFLSFFYY